jgi:hypothetical protein
MTKAKHRFRRGIADMKGIIYMSGEMAIEAGSAG